MVISKRFTAITIPVLLIILLFALFIDLPLSQHFMNQNSIFGTVFQDFGLFPPTLILIISMIILNFYVFTHFKNRVAQYIILLMTFLYTLIKTNLFVSETFKYIFSTIDNIQKHKPMGVASNEGDASNTLSLGTSYVITFILLIIIAFSVYQFWLKQVTALELERLFKVAFVSFLVLLIGLELIDSLKEMWGRARPYEIGHHGAYFTNWLTVNGNTGHSSFPSGHTTDAAFLMFMAFYFNTRVAQKRMFLIGFMFTIIMCASRLRIGAHFLGDVTMAFTLILLLIIAADYIIYKWHDKNQIT
ncbi:phosphatase PAP2 family protein [Staphylococcus sp. ACRSN]|uniref:phosphatase PAP2 family protein n=1 Tax=Staphylococcus sp. ACRSN TaxID=2918214 RepID=UPI001EF30A6F|nr:phosphatase PAP2 family protein [Staphylococcus sp. ACRSN]MCG7338030.1 phosphatase PAP2 family protein [Staphylococcus sp. ACRSN]